VLLVAVVAAESTVGASGSGPVVLIALTCVLVGGTGLVLGGGRRYGRTVAVVLLSSLVTGSIALAWLVPGGLGCLGGFVAASAVAFRLPRLAGQAVAGLLLAVYVTASFVGAHESVSSILVGAAGTAACYGLGWFMHQLRERTVLAESLAIELDRGREAQVAAAQTAERQHLAREMHDVLAHSLSGLVLNLEYLRLRAETSGAEPDLIDVIARSRRPAQNGLVEARQAIGVLRSAELPGPERLGSLAAAFARDSGVRCEVAIDGEPAELGAQARLTLYRVAQEAMTNIRRHTRADRVEVRLGYAPDGTTLTVEDFAADAVRRRVDEGYGINGMRERARLLGGTLDAAATPNGFRVALWVPS